MLTFDYISIAIIVLITIPTAIYHAYKITRFYIRRNKAIKLALVEANKLKEENNKVTTFKNAEQGKKITERDRYIELNFK